MTTTNDKNGRDLMLDVRDLTIHYETDSGVVHAVEGLNLQLGRGESLGFVGETGAGKTTTALGIMRLIPNPPGRIKSGEILFEGENLLSKSEAEMRHIRGAKIAMIFQDPMTSLNPVLTVRWQMEESLRRHRVPCDRHDRAVDMLKRVGIVPAERRLTQYPFQFSGGQRQRIMIAMAMICNPDLLIADEPTTALDVTVQAQILELMKELQGQFGTSIILITHDLGVIAGMADRVLVMYGGRIMERGTRREIFYEPAHPYTRGLLRSVPNPEELVRQRLIPIEGQPPDLLNPPAGCPYAPRCPEAMRVCLEYPPERTELTGSHNAACWLLNRPAGSAADRKEGAR